MDADRFIASVETSIARGEWLDPARSAVTVKEWAARWLATRTDLRATTRARLIGVVNNHVVKEFGARKLSSLSNGEVREWVGRMQENGTGTTTIRKSVFALKQMLDAAIADRRLAVNAAANVPVPSEKADERLWMTREQADALAEVIDADYRIVVLLGYFCGLRMGEITALRRQDIDTLRSKITVARTASVAAGQVSYGLPKTKAGSRTLPVARSVMRQIEDHLAERVGSESDAMVVTGRTGGHLHGGSFRARVWQPAIRAAGLPPLTPHSMRHGFASTLIADGFDIAKVSKWCGHSTVEVTLKVYTHVADDESDDDVDRLDAAYRAATKPSPRSAPVSRIG